jgi:iron complex outermembrane receptor protein
MTRKYLFLLLPGLLLSLLVLEARAQTATVRGTVFDADSDQPLPGANVVLFRSGNLIMGTATNDDGHYELHGVNPGTYELVARFVGFQDAEVSITLAAGAEETVDVRLTPGVNLNPVVVTASRQQEKVLDSPASISVLEAREIEQDAAPSAAATLRNTTGVDIVQAGLDRYQIALRGFNAAFVSKTYAMVDFRQTVTPSLGINQFGSMPISPIDLAQIEVVRGPGSALYGPGVEQGVIHFITKDPFTYPGTTVSIGGGQQQLVQGSFRHAGVVNDRLGYKVVGYYSQGEDWKLDPNDPADKALLDAIAPNVGGRDYDTWKGYVLGTLQYRARPNVTITANGGYSALKGINISNTGENQSDNFASFFGQLRVDAGGFFAQAYLNKNDAGDTFIYRSGATIVDKSTQFTGQAQYTLSLADGRENVVAGVDYKRTDPVTEGTIHGREENNDTINEYGAYVQSETVLTPQLDLVAAARVDFNDVTEETQLSPRVGLVYKATPEHTFRATFNRAFSTPAGVNFFLDLVVQDAGAFLVRARGAARGWTFPNPPQTSSFVPVPGLDPRDPGVGIALARAYAAATAGLIGEGGPFAGLPDSFKGLLLSKVTQIPGVSEGFMAFISGSNVRPVTELNDLPPIKQTITNSVEVGYRGVFGKKVLVGLDVYYTQKQNFLSELQFVTPFVLVPNVPADLAGAVAGAFTDAELAPFGLNAAALAGIYQQAAAALAGGPIGLVETNENFDPATRPELMLTYINFGDVDYFGADLEVQALVSERLSIFGNYSWVSDNFFDDAEVGEPGTGLVISMNAPKNKVRGGFTYTDPSGFSFNAAGRYVDKYEVRSGVHQGTVDSYFLLDLGAGYDFGRHAPGLRIDVTAQNVFDNRHREYVDVPEIGRLVMARLTYTLQ